MIPRWWQLGLRGRCTVLRPLRRRSRRHWDRRTPALLVGALETSGGIMSTSTAWAMAAALAAMAMPGGLIGGTTQPGETRCVTY
jgi:hypothetical protein